MKNRRANPNPIRAPLRGNVGEYVFGFLFMCGLLWLAAGMLGVIS